MTISQATISAPMSSPFKHSSYDILLLGGGQASCVLANRLSSLASAPRILLLEAGLNHNAEPRVTIPGAFNQSFDDPTIDYAYSTVPQPHLDNKRIAHARGKGLGGSSLINYMALVHPSRSGFDAWAEINDDKGWNWENMIRYIRRYQTWNAPSDIVAKAVGLDDEKQIDRMAQGTEGPIQASYNDEDGLELDRVWIEAFRELGYIMQADRVSGRGVGAYQTTSAITKGRERSHAGSAYLEPVLNRENLEVVTGVVVDKVLLEEKEGKIKAIGAEVLIDGQRHAVRAGREVILCAGVFGSPTILERSGIGSRTHLEKLGVEIVVENENVGEGLQDHLMTSIAFQVRDGVTTLDNFRDPAYIQSAMMQYQRDRTGPMASTSSNFAYMPLLDENEEDSREFQSLIERHLGPKTIEGIEKKPEQTWAEALTRRVLEDKSEASANVCMVKMQSHLERNTPSEIFGITDPGNYVSWFTALAHPLSRGHVHATSLDPEAAPEIDPKYFSHPLDEELMARHVKLYDRLANTEALKRLLKPKQEGGQTLPEWARFDAMEERKKLLRFSSMSNQHPCGTCAMLPRDKGGVVNSRLKVYGVEGLRIVDASAIPLISRGNLMATVYPLAEKAADMMKEDLVL